jgi:hypothetical protein
MADLGFIIPLDINDYLNQGQRVNWCGGTWWTNQNLQLSGTVSGTTAKVGDDVTIQVGIQGVTNQGFTEEAQVQHVQAWVCYPNTMPGRADASLIVFSMQPAHGGQPPSLDLTGSPQVIFGSAQVFDYQNPADGTYHQFSLAPVWTPSDQDILPPNTTAHVCIVGTSQGIADVNGAADPVGLFVPNNNDLSGIDICTDPHQGQTNITIVPISGGQIKPGGGLHEFGFLSGAAVRDRRAQVTVEIRPVRQGNEVDPAVLKVLRSGPYAKLAFRPAAAPPRTLRLRRSTHECKGWLARIVCEAEEILEDAVEAVEGLVGWGHDDDRHGRRLKLTLPPKGLQPLVLQTDLDTSEAPGSVHVFDIVQTDADGRRGGIRVGAVIVP